MGTREVGLSDVHSGPPPSRKRLLAPLRYLAIKHPEKTWYDFLVPGLWALVMITGYWLVEPKPALFSDAGLIKLVRDLLIMAVPFMVGALAAVAMGAPGGEHMDRRLIGAPLYLDGESLTLRQFVCYLLGYLCFISLALLIASVAATLFRDAVMEWTCLRPSARLLVRAAGTAVLFAGLSTLTVTVLWSLYFLTAVINRRQG